MLILPIKKRWFDMILSGEKKEEYRDITPYYETRFKNLWGDRYMARERLCLEMDIQYIAHLLL